VNDPAIGHCLNGRSDVLTATLAGDDKRMNAFWWALEHGDYYSEQKAKCNLGLYLALVT